MRKSSSLAVYIIIVVMVAMVILGFITYDSNTISRITTATRDLTTGIGWWSAVIFGLAYLIIALSGFSVTVMSLVAVVVFPALEAFLIISIAPTLSALLAFEFARHSYRQRDTQVDSMSKIMKATYRFRVMLESQIQRKQFISLSLLRLSGVPYIVLSYAAGYAVGIRRYPFITATLLVNVLYGAIYVIVGAVLVRYVIFVAVALLLLFIAFRLYRHYHPVALKTVI